jgi:hypothetical protein
MEKKLSLLGLVLSGLLVVSCASEPTTIVPSNGAATEIEMEAESDLEVTPPEEDATASSADLGSRENPLPIGTTVILNDGYGGIWEITLLPPTLEANGLVQDENRYNDPAPEGFQFALLPVSAKYLGDETGTPAWDLDFSFVSNAGTTHKQYDVSVVSPDPLSDVNELYKDAIGQGNVVIAIPTLDAELGTWRVDAGDNTAFFSAK